MKNEGGTWKFLRFYEQTPYQEYEQMAKPYLFSPLSAVDWDATSDLDPGYLVSYYRYQFLMPLVDQYGPDHRYAVVSADEAVANLALHLNGVTKEILIAASADRYTATEYDAAADSFRIEMVFDPGAFTVCGVEEMEGGQAIIQSLGIAKSDKAVRWEYATVQKDGESLRYLSNRVEEIPDTAH